MALKHVDLAVVEQHVMTLLADATQIAPPLPDCTIVPRGRPQPGQNEPAWARLVRIDAVDAPEGRQVTANEPSRVRVTVVMNVAVRSAGIKASAYTLSQVLGYVAALLKERRTEDTVIGQSLTTEKAECRQDGESDDDRGIQTGVVIVQGWAVRTG